MRTWTKAAALLLVQSVVGESMPVSGRRVSATETVPTAYITLNVSVDGAETQVVPFRLDLAEAEEPCSPANVRVNGQRLTQDADGHGHGALALDQDLSITANWTFACESLKQALTIHVHSVNGSPVSDADDADASLIAHFYQTTPVQIASVERVASVRYLHLHTTVTESLDQSGEEHSYGDGGAPGDGVVVVTFEEQVSRLMDLRGQARELAALIRHQKAAIAADGMQQGLRAGGEHAPTPLGECRDVRCAFKALAYRLTHSHDGMCKSASGWRAVFGCASMEEKQWWEEDDEFDDEFGMADRDDVEWMEMVSQEGFYATYEEDMMAAEYNYTRRRMLMLVAETAFVFGAAVFCFTALLRRLTHGHHRCRPRTSSELPLYQNARYFDEPKTLISFAFVDGPADGTSYPGYDDDDDDDVDDDDKVVLREAACSETTTTTTTTLADTFLELRAAAEVVSDLVAVEAEGQDEAPPAYKRVDVREHSL
ncbi:hypothetical protein MY11210_001141 [Beauveria gryllotalpidicola]